MSKSKSVEVVLDVCGIRLKWDHTTRCGSSVYSAIACTDKGEIFGPWSVSEKLRMYWCLNDGQNVGARRLTVRRFRDWSEKLGKVEKIGG